MGINYTATCECGNDIDSDEIVYTCHGCYDEFCSECLEEFNNNQYCCNCLPLAKTGEFK